LYADLKKLFSEVLKKQLSEQDYIQLFMVRVPENLQKIERIEKIYQEILETPQEVFSELDAQKNRLIQSRQKFGDYISPLKFA
jgi:phosphoenolpyruvate carboxykinase (GTP)